MSKHIIILATADTKGEECEFLRRQIISFGATATLIDIGVMQDPEIEVDYAAANVASIAGADLTDLRQQASRQIASETMIIGATKIVKELIANQKADAIIGLGGTQGTSNCTSIMQQLPYGLPKIMVSTMASGDVSAYVGVKDITMMFSVSDILGLNPFLRNILANAAGAAWGMACSDHKSELGDNAIIVAITNLGVLTRGTMHMIVLLKQLGYQSMVFHAVGSGGEAMEQMMRAGIIHAVIDYALGDICDAVLDGIRAAEPTRLTVAGELGLPQVIIPGGIDHIGILLSDPAEMPEKYKNRLYSYHNPVILVPRTSGSEMLQVMSSIAERLNSTTKDAVFMLPLQGVSSYSAQGGDLLDLKQDAIFNEAVKTMLPAHIPLIEMDNNAEDEEFVARAVAEMDNLIKQKAKDNL
ncbi:MAG: Tm-1-like ATP-binding domain-containing protein [Rhizobiales bacterium]|nr:Tm-1-like ATP-binding domain-containing protein [Hyphomicrobiales bacterium]NRB15782.1 Tm-1-like ATP-binding domain-containing protein [Hyphomicrobiales bacterium]